MLKRPHYIALGLVLLSALILLNLPGRTTARLKLGISSLFVPLFGLVSSTQQAVGKAADAVVPRSELVRQNEALRRENQELKLELSRAEPLARENQRLREMLHWQQQQKRGKYKAASVILRDPANWWRMVQIDLGQRQGVSNNLPVLAPSGALVGRITSAGLTTSQVLLLGDPNCKVAARVSNRSHDIGIIRGSGPLEPDFVELARLSRGANLKAGDEVRTSGEGGLFPKDILVGKVADWRPAEYGLETVARVKLGADLNALEEVWVMLEP